MTICFRIDRILEFITPKLDINKLSPERQRRSEGCFAGIFLIGEKNNSRKQHPCQRKEAFGSY